MDTQVLEPSYASLVKQVNELSSIIFELREANKQLQSQVDWFNRQLFGEKSEKYHSDKNLEALPLFEQLDESCSEVPQESTEVKPHVRKKRGKTQSLGNNDDSGLRFDDKVEIVEEEFYPDEIKELSPENYEIIGKEVSDRLASKPSRNFVHRRIFYKVKLKDSSELSKQIVPKQVFDRSYLSASFLADMILDKCLYSLPLNRQHQRLKLDGFHLSRGTLTSNFIKACMLLSPIAKAQMFSVLLSRVLAIDETPIRVGVDKVKHKMKKGYVWPIYGERNEICYHYHRSRAASVLKELIPKFDGVLLSDGYSAYKSYASGLKEASLSPLVEQASCWIHARRKFVELEALRPVEHARAIELIGKLYKIESECTSSKYDVILSNRRKLSLPIVDDYFDWLKSFNGKGILATNKKLRNAILYSLDREESMRVFLKNPKVALDTNHVEREIRTFTVGRKNWLFCCVPQGCINCLGQAVRRMHKAVEKMMVGPSESTVRSRFQTTLSGCC